MEWQHWCTLQEKVNKKTASVFLSLSTNTAVSWAAEKGRKFAFTICITITFFTGFEKIVQMLVERGADVNAVNKDGISVLDAASNATTGNSKIATISMVMKQLL